MIAAWDAILGREVKATPDSGDAFRGVVVAVAMESAATATAATLVGEFQFLIVDEDGQAHQVAADHCQFVTNFRRNDIPVDRQFKKKETSSGDAATNV